ncbi:MAG: membrane protein insertion efficiency factor YidD [Spirochaetes bacterium]|nr:MAG: membrane protein insertion efficiency factor YidD [Spirochaetota bacterium]
MKNAIPTALLGAALLLGAGATARPAFSGERFAPWDADVRTGDESIFHENAPHSHESAVYNGAQGAGFFLIRFFQVVISSQDGPNCRYRPTCSAYGRAAVERHGLALGMFLAGDRLLRCNPYNPPVSDPVPAEILGK